MAIVNISLPDKMKEYIDERVGEGRFSSASEYIRDLVRDDQKRKGEERLEALLLEGLDSGLPIEASDGYVNQKRAELMARIEKKLLHGR